MRKPGEGLHVEHASRSFGPIAAVRDLSFAVQPAGVFGLLGPNGAGKTTTMRLILGIYAPDSGTIAWRGRPIDAATRRGFGYLPEERGLYGKTKVRDQMVYFGRLHGLSKADAAARAARWLADLSLEPDAERPCGELSKGNQQKVQLACAALHDPPLLVLDEPFSALDPLNAETIRACIERLAQNGTTVVLSSHQMWQIEDFCKSFCFIGDGAVKAAGSLAELRDAFPTRAIRVAPDTPEVRRSLETRAAQFVARDGDAVVYDVPARVDFAALLRDVVAVAPVSSFERREPSLSDIYKRALGGAAATPSAG